MTRDLSRRDDTPPATAAPGGGSSLPGEGLDLPVELVDPDRVAGLAAGRGEMHLEGPGGVAGEGAGAQDVGAPADDPPIAVEADQLDGGVLQPVDVAVDV